MAGSGKHATRTHSPAARVGLDWHKLLAGYFDRLPLWLPKSVADGYRPHIDVGAGPSPMPRGNAPAENDRINRRKCAELPYHATEAKKWDRLEAVLCDVEFVEAKVRVGLANDLLRDYDHALDRLPETRAARERERKRPAEVLEQLLAFARGDRDEPPASARYMTDAEFDAEAHRLATAPTRADLLHLFDQFVRGDKHLLDRFGAHPRFVIQHAATHYDGGLVQERAAEALEADKRNSFFGLAKGHREPFNATPALRQVVEVNPASALPGARGVSHHVVLSSDGCIAVSYHGRMELRVTSVATGRCERVLYHHADALEGLAVWAGGATAVSLSRRFGPKGDRKFPPVVGGLIRVWGTLGRRLRRSIEVAEGPVNALTLSADGKSLAYVVGQSGVVRLVEFETGSQRNLEVSEDPIHRLAISTDGHRLVIASLAEATRRGSLRVVDVQTAELLNRIELPESSNRVDRLAVDARCRMAIITTSRGVSVWDLRRGTRELLLGALDPRGSVGMSADGRLAMHSGYDINSYHDAIRVWDVPSRELLTVLRPPAQGDNVLDISASISADGSVIASAASDGTLAFWTPGRGRMVHGYAFHTKNITCLTTNRDGSVTVTGSEDGTVRVWNRNGECLSVLDFTHVPLGVQLFSDELLAVTTGHGRRGTSSNPDAGRLQIFNVRTGRFVCDLEIDAVDGPRFVQPLRDNLVAVAAGQRIQIFSADTGHVVHQLNTSAEVGGLTYSASAHQLFSAPMRATGSAKGRFSRLAELWDTRSFRRIGTIEMAGERGGTRMGDQAGIVASGNGEVAAWWAASTNVVIWDVSKRRQRLIVNSHMSADTLALSEDGKRLILAEGSTLEVWCTRTGECLHQPETGRQFFSKRSSLSIAANGERAAVTDSEGNVHLWDLENWRRLAMLEREDTHDPAHAALSGDGKRLVHSEGPKVFARDTKTQTLLWKASGDTLQLWPPESRTARHAVVRSRGRVAVLDTERAAIVSSWLAPKFGNCWVTRDIVIACEHSDQNPSRIRLWDWKAQRERCVKRISGAVHRAVLHSDGTSLLAVGRGTEVCIIDLGASDDASEDVDARDTCTRLPHDDRVSWVTGLAVSRDERMFATGGWFGGICLWNWAKAEQLHRLEGHTGSVAALAFSPDGTLLASGAGTTGSVCAGYDAKGGDSDVRVWDTRTGKCLAVLRGHTAGVRCVEFVCGGRRLMSASDDGTLRVWETATLECVHVLGEGRPAQAHVQVDQDRFAFAKWGRVLSCWDLGNGRLLCRTVTQSDGPARTYRGRTIVGDAVDGVAVYDLENIASFARKA